MGFENYKFGNLCGVDTIFFLDEDLDSIPALAKMVPIVIINLNIERHSPDKVAVVLRTIKEISGVTQFVFVTMSGYDYDSRELQDVPEVRQWAQEFLLNGNDVLGVLADERTCQTDSAPAALRFLSDGTIGRAKMCVLAGYGETIKRDGEQWMKLDDTAQAMLDSIGIKTGSA